MTPDLSIIIVNWNTRQILVKCLQSARDNLKDITHEVFVVDNGSTDGSASMIRKEFPEVLLIENQENIGFAKANNQALRLCHGRYILFLNSDAFLSPEAIQKLIHVMESDLSVGIAGPSLTYPDGTFQVSHGPLPNYWTETSSLFGLDKLPKRLVNHKDIIETGTVSGACMLVRKTLLDHIGVLDEDFFFFSEEVDLCYRCHKAGYKVVHVPTAIVIHVQGASTGQTVQRLIRLYMGKLHYFYKHFGPNSEHNLKLTMVVSVKFKGLFYRILRIFSIGRIRKDEFWLAVSKELTTIFL